MKIIDQEIEEIRKFYENVPDSRIIACTTLAPPLVRVNIQGRQANCQFTVCLRFPADYPQEPLLVELKSRLLSEKFLNVLAELGEKHARQHLNQAQGLEVLRFLQRYVDENPLCICFDEIHALRREIGTDSTGDQLKLKQRTSTVQLLVRGGEYYYRVQAVVPDKYPRCCVDLRQPESNLPAVLLRFLNGQSREIARQCVEPPLRLSKDQVNFLPKPSLYRALKFCVEATREFCNELCPICEQLVLPRDPNQLEKDDNNDASVERVYCGHLYHQGCLKLYLQEPPFPKDGKVCPAKCLHPRSDVTYYLGDNPKSSADKAAKGNRCGLRLSHDRWVVNVKVAESRWAQKQARERELEEVVDFLK